MYPIRKYYNINADLPFKEKRIPNFKIEHIKNSFKIFPRKLLLWTVLSNKYYRIPSEIKTFYSEYRLTPLTRAENLERYLKLPKNIEIHYKDESTSPTHSFKLNAAFPLVFYAKKAGFKKVICGTGAGQWGLALAYAANKLDLDCQVFMSLDSYYKKKKIVSLMKKNGAKVIPAQGNSYSSTKKMALKECLETNSFYPEIDLEIFQSIIGLETRLQLKQKNIIPDVMIGCLGGGSNLIGFISPFIKEKLEGKNKIRFISIESKHIPKLTKGEYKYSSNEFLPPEKKYGLDENYVIPKDHMVGLRDVSATKVTSLLYHHGVIEAKTCSQREAIIARSIFNKTERINSAPEAAHAIKGAIKEALSAKKNKEPKIIIFNLTGSDILG